MRVGLTAFVSFPNFAHWRTRARCCGAGECPSPGAAGDWFETRNIHHVTVADFEALAGALVLTIRRRWFFSGDKRLAGPVANCRAELALSSWAREDRTEERCCAIGDLARNRSEAQSPAPGPALSGHHPFRPIQPQPVPEVQLRRVSGSRV